jgi:hypothetical protein
MFVLDKFCHNCQNALNCSLPQGNMQSLLNSMFVRATSVIPLILPRNVFHHLLEKTQISNAVSEKIFMRCLEERHFV